MDKYIRVRLDMSLYERLKKHCKDNGKVLQVFTAEALESYLKIITKSPYGGDKIEKLKEYIKNM